MSIIDFIKNNITNIKNQFGNQKVPSKLQKDDETMAYLNKI